MRNLLERWASTRLAGNELLDWLIAAGVLLGIAIVLRLAQSLLVSRLARATARTTTRLDDVALEVLRATRVWFHLTLAVYVAEDYVKLDKSAQTTLHLIAAILIGLQFGLWAQTAVNELSKSWAASGTGQNKTMAGGLRLLATLVIWTLVLLAVLSNMGVELSAVVAGLGVGGVAAALAVQSTLGDLIAGVSMYFDRPFDIGDFIIVDSYMGTVQRIGMRTTRVASLGGEEIVFSNGDLVKARVRNYARMRERRILFAFGIEYNVPAAKIERAQQIVADIIKGREGLRFDRVHFKQYGAYSLDFEVVYFVLSPDFNVYMDHQHAINMAMYRAFEEDGIPFAFPTQTIFTKRLDAPQPEEKRARG